MMDKIELDVVQWPSSKCHVQPSNLDITVVAQLIEWEELQVKIPPEQEKQYEPVLEISNNVAF